MKALAELIEEGNRQRSSQDGNHVVLDGPEWDLLMRTIDFLRAERDGALEVIRRYEEIKATVTAQVFANDAIRKASRA